MFLIVASKISEYVHKAIRVNGLIHYMWQYNPVFTRGTNNLLSFKKYVF